MRLPEHGDTIVKASTFFDALIRITEARTRGQLRRLRQRLDGREPDARLRYLLGRLAAREQELAGSAQPVAVPRVNS
jgi:hypothetical protein